MTYVAYERNAAGRRRIADNAMLFLHATIRAFNSIQNAADGERENIGKAVLSVASTI